MGYLGYFATSYVNYYPNLYDQEISEIGVSDEAKAGFTLPTTETYSPVVDKFGLLMRQSYWNVDMTSAYFGEGYSVLYNPTRYWVASRCGSCNTYYAQLFKLRVSGNALDRRHYI